MYLGWARAWLVVWVVFAYAVVFSPPCSGHKCVHNSLPHIPDSPAHLKPDLYPAQQGSGRKLNGLPWEPLRVHVVYQFGTSTLSTEQNFLKNKLVPESVAFWESTLSVKRPAVLRVEPFCPTFWETSPVICHSITTPAKCAHINIDPPFLASIKYCTGPQPHLGCKNSPGGAGVAADYILYINSDDSELCGGGSSGETSTLAYATSCKRDANDRPVMGYINFCPAKVDVTASEYHQQYKTALHELAHALGFASSSWAKMRTYDGDLRTPNRAKQQYQCRQGTTQEIEVPSTQTVKLVSHRGKDAHMMVTPRVMEISKQYYGCSTVEGAELEDEVPTSQCLGSHWDERTMYDELMSPVVQGHPEGNRVSAFTLALFEDTGWYKANYANAEPMVWGHKAGCDFINKKCVNPSTQTALPDPPNTFCDTNGEEGCTYDLKAEGKCQVSTYNGALPPAFQYFAASNRGGPNSHLDYCPIYQPYSNRHCSDTSVNAELGSHGKRGQLYSSKSFCAKTTLKADGNWAPNGVDFKCYTMVCGTNKTINIILNRQYLATPTAPVTVQCKGEGGNMLSNVPGFSGYLVCPDHDTVCPTENNITFNESAIMDEVYREIGRNRTGATGEDSSSTSDENILVVVIVYLVQLAADAAGVSFTLMVVYLVCGLIVCCPLLVLCCKCKQKHCNGKRERGRRYVAERPQDRTQAVHGIHMRGVQPPNTYVSKDIRRQTIEMKRKGPSGNEPQWHQASNGQWVRGAAQTRSSQQRGSVFL